MRKFLIRLFWTVYWAIRPGALQKEQDRIADEIIDKILAKELK